MCQGGWWVGRVGQGSEVSCSVVLLNKREIDKRERDIYRQRDRDRDREKKKKEERKEKERREKRKRKRKKKYIV